MKPSGETREIAPPIARGKPSQITKRNSPTKQERIARPISSSTPCSPQRTRPYEQARSRELGGHHQSLSLSLSLSFADSAFFI